MEDAAAADLIKLHMPEVRNRVLLLLSSKAASQIAAVDGKKETRFRTACGDKAAVQREEPRACCSKRAFYFIRDSVMLHEQRFSLSGRSGRPAQRGHRRRRRNSESATRPPAFVPIIWRPRSVSCAGACLRLKSSMSALRGFCALACSISCAAAQMSPSARYGPSNSANSCATWWCRAI